MPTSRSWASAAAHGIAAMMIAAVMAASMMAAVKAALGMLFMDCSCKVVEETARIGAQLPQRVLACVALTKVYGS